MGVDKLMKTIGEKIIFLDKRLTQLNKVMKIAEKKVEITSLEKQSQESDFWKNQEKAQNLMKQLALIKEEVEAVEKLSSKLADLNELIRAESGEEAETLMP